MVLFVDETQCLLATFSEIQTVTTTADVITDFERGVDTLQITGMAAGNAENFKAATASETGFDAAKTVAAELLKGEVLYAFVTDGRDGYLFIDNNDENGAGEVILLTGLKTEDSFTATDIESFSA